MGEMPALVDAAWLAARLDDPALRVFDATKYLPGEGKDGQAGFQAGHVRGARFFDIDLFADPETSLPHMAPAAGRFGRLAGEAGIGAESLVVFYDQKGQASAARGWWLMRLFGHGAVALLDGGLPAWIAAGGGVETGEPGAVTPGAFVPSLHAHRMVGIGDVLDNLRTQAAVVVDARPGSRFAGGAAEPRAGVAPGHIPGSRSLPVTELLDAGALLLAPEMLRARLAQAGVDGRRAVVTTCGTGVTAALLAFAIERAGLPAAAVYDGSWTEWGGRDDTPKALGADA